MTNAVRTVRAPAASFPALALALALLGVACAAPGTLQAIAAEPAVTRLEPAGTKLRLPVELRSTYAEPLELRYVEWEVTLHDRVVAVGSVAVSGFVAPGASATVEVPLSLEHPTGLPVGLRTKLEKSRRAPLGVRGELVLAGGDFEVRAPFAREVVTAKVTPEAGAEGESAATP